MALLTTLATSAGPYFDASYPGYRPEVGTGIGADVAFSAVQAGVQAYFCAFGSWPDSWAEVVREGLYQASLPAFQGGTINPDEHSLDFNGDVRYVPAEGQQTPQVLRATEMSDDNGVYSCPLVPLRSYEDRLSGTQPEELRAEYAPHLADMDMLRLFGILHCVAQSLSIYKSVYGEVPADWEELCQSGLSPTGENGINPVTGQQFRGDGSAGDIYYEKLGPEQFLLHHVNRDGSYPHWRITY